MECWDIVPAEIVDQGIDRWTQHPIRHIVIDRDQERRDVSRHRSDERTGGGVATVDTRNRHIVIGLGEITDGANRTEQEVVDQCGRTGVVVDHIYHRKAGVYVLSSFLRPGGKGVKLVHADFFDQMA